jgi:carbamoyl-phosphate synthase large subunit
MPKRKDIKKICLIGSGPIVIGQACEFDYSGTQAVKALKDDGYEVILVNSNPATIMTDPDFADATYIEPMTPVVVGRILEKERPDALLPTLGGQTALNLTVELGKRGILEKYGVELLGASLESIHMAEDRSEFKDCMARIGVDVPKSGLATHMDEAMEVIKQVGFPAILRPAFTLGGTGGNVAYNMEEYKEYARYGLDQSPSSQVLIEESLLGWKEFELEVMRDKKDNVVIICSIENLDPMGVHTGDSITIAPAQTLSDKEYQILRDDSLKIIRAIGVDTGGSNIQFAVNPSTGRSVAIEMNPRVSRSSALASKATGFPIAKIATKLAVGYTLDEILNDITRYTPAAFEPSIDYVVTKVPRFTFEKFPHADPTLTTQMKSVGEDMAIGRTFKESFQKALRSLEVGSFGFESKAKIRPANVENKKKMESLLRRPTADRIWYVADAMRMGFSNDEIYQYSGIDPWFLAQIRDIVDAEKILSRKAKGLRGKQWGEILAQAKSMGFSDERLGALMKKKPEQIKDYRKKYGVAPVFKRVDTCAAEFEAYTPYLYSTYEREDEAEPTKSKKKVVILGGGPNRIGQGIEFDYCCVHASLALREEGYESIMVNCNPETVSTDYDISDRLYFEPLTEEDVLSILEHEKPMGVIVQFGGQTPLKLAHAIENRGFNILGTSPDSIDLAEDRKRFQSFLKRLKLKQPPNGTARSLSEARKIAKRIGYPVVVRPSYVLGGRAMEIVFDDRSLSRYMSEAVKASQSHPILIDKFLQNALEIDVDCVSDGKSVVIGGVMEHIEEAGVHSGDSACCLPPHSLDSKILAEIQRQTIAMAKELKVIGLMNVQYAVKDGEIFILEVNPRASRTAPFVSKAIGRPLAKLAAKAMAGISLKKQGFTQGVVPPYLSVKECVLPFEKFPGVDTLLGPEMKSTGEVMGIARDFGEAFAKAEFSAGTLLPRRGQVFISVNDQDKPEILLAAQKLADLGFDLIATRGTQAFLSAQGVSCKAINKVLEGSPHIVDALKNGEVAMVVNTPLGKDSAQDSYSIRRTALEYRIPYFTTLAAANAAVNGISAMVKRGFSVQSLQAYHRQINQESRGKKVS